jgi:hypothetical protein
MIRPLLRPLLLPLLLSLAACASRPSRPALPDDSEQFNAVLMAKRPELVACYENALKKKSKPWPEGSITVRLLLDIDGKVGDAQITENSLNFLEAELCVVNTLKKTRFPASTSNPDRIISFPLHFQVPSA